MASLNNPGVNAAALLRKIEEYPDSDNFRMTPTEAAAYIPMSIGALAQLRYMGHGPKFMKPSGRIVLYRKGDIDNWLESSVRTSTAEVVR